MASKRWWRRSVVIVPTAIVAVTALTLALAAFQPWRLFIDVTVDEALPTVLSRRPSNRVRTPPRKSPRVTPVKTRLRTQALRNSQRPSPTPVLTPPTRARDPPQTRMPMPPLSRASRKPRSGP